MLRAKVKMRTYDPNTNTFGETFCEELEECTDNFCETHIDVFCGNYNDYLPMRYRFNLSDIIWAGEIEECCDCEDFNRNWLIEFGGNSGQTCSWDENIQSSCSEESGHIVAASMGIFPIFYPPLFNNIDDIILAFHLPCSVGVEVLGAVYYHGTTNPSDPNGPILVTKVTETVDPIGRPFCQGWPATITLTPDL